MNNKKLLGKRIKEIRKEAGYTQETLAEAVNIDITTLSGIESGRHFPSLVTLEKIADTLNSDLINFFDFYNHLDIEDMRSIISENLKSLSAEDVKLVFKLINKKYLNK